MRLLHISDLHIYKRWIDDLEDDDLYLKAFLSDLAGVNEKKEVDLVLITGDLADQGGRSFNDADYYKIIEERIFNAIADALDIAKERIIFIPGNHDVNENRINEHYEVSMEAKTSFHQINELVRTVSKTKDYEAIVRLEKFNDFASRYYASCPDARLSLFESYFIHHFDKTRVGIIGLNSAWRCSSKLPPGKLFLGPLQIARAKKFLEDQKTDLNIALLHHPIESFTDEEQQEIRTSLKRSNIHLVLCGHRHSPNNHKSSDSVGDVVFSVGRSVFNQTEDTPDTISKFEPGYSIIDLSRTENALIARFHCRKYEAGRKEFDVDTRAGGEGKYEYAIKVDFKKKDLSYLPLEAAGNTPKIARLTDEWTQKTEELIQSAFPKLKKKIVKRIKDHLLPDTLNYFHRGLTLKYEITKFDKNHFCLKEEQSFTIVSNGSAVPLDMEFYIERKNVASDKSGVIIEEFVVDGKDRIHDIVEKKWFKEDGAFQIIEVRFAEMLPPGKREYEVRRVVRTIHSNKLNGIWRYDIGVITENTYLTVNNEEKYELDIVEFGNNINLMGELESMNFKGGRTFDLMMPGQGFILIIK